MDLVENARNLIQKIENHDDAKERLVESFKDLPAQSLRAIYDNPFFCSDDFIDKLIGFLQNYIKNQNGIFGEGSPD